MAVATPGSVAGVSLVGGSPWYTTKVPFVEDRSTTVMCSPSRTNWAWRRDTPVSWSSGTSGWMPLDWLVRPTSEVCPVSVTVEVDGGGHGWSASDPFRAYHSADTSTTTTHATSPALGARGTAPGGGAGAGGVCPVVKS